MIERLSPAARNALLALIGILVLWFAWSVRSVLNPLIAGYFLAYAIHPMVLRLQRKGWTRRRAVNTIFVLVGLVLTLSLALIGLQARRLVLEGPELLAKVELEINTLLSTHRDKIAWFVPEEAEPEGDTEPAGEPVDEQVGEPVDEQLDEQIAEEAALELTWEQLLGRIGAEFFTGEHAAEAGRVGLQVAESGWLVSKRAFGTGIGVVMFFFLLPIYTYFLLFELERIHAFVRRYLPRRDRERLSRIGRQIGEVVSNFFRGRLLVCVLKGLVITAGLLIARVDFALLIGMGAGFLSLVPFVGPLLAAVVAFLVSLGDHGLLYSLLATAIVFTGAEVIEGYVLIPKILGDSLGLHPVVVLLSVFIGGAALGMFGLLIAIPLTASLVILFRELVLPALAQFADEGG